MPDMKMEGGVRAMDSLYSDTFGKTNSIKDDHIRPWLHEAIKHSIILSPFILTPEKHFMLCVFFYDKKMVCSREYKVPIP